MVCLYKRAVVRLIIFLVCISFASFGNPIRLIENKGQWKGKFDFGARIPGGFFKLSKGAFEYSFLDQSRFNHHHQPTLGYDERDRLSSNNSICGHIVRTEFLGSNKNSLLSKFGQSTDYFNFFLGKENWQSAVYAYEGGLYSSFYEGIDLKVYSSGGHLKYDFIVSPGVSSDQIQWKYSGTDQVELRNGEISVNTSITSITEMKPVAYQIIDGKKVFVKCEYVLCDGVFSFSVGEYDTCYELVIDPILIFSTYSGFSADNWGSTATPGEHGTLYSSGVVNLGNVGGTFPATPGSFQTNYGGNYDVAIYKYDSIGHNLIYTSFLGGRYTESPHSLVIDRDDNLLVLGTTSSTDFPTTNGVVSQTFRGGTFVDSYYKQYKENPVPFEIGSDLFVAKISADGKTLLASTLLGGISNDGLNPNFSSIVQNYGDQMRGDIISDKTTGDIFISTVTSSSDFPSANSFSVSFHGGNTDALVVRLKSDLTQIVWGALIGGSGDDASHTIQIDADGDLFVAGGTTSTNFPVTSSVYQTSLAGDVDGWIAKIKGDGSQILNCTYTGTSSFDEVFFLDVDNAQNVYVYGQTSGSFPVTAGVYSNSNSGQFLQKFTNSLDKLDFSTVFGSGIGIPNISPTAFLVNDCGNIYMSGWGGGDLYLKGFWSSTTKNMPITSDAVQKTTQGSDFYFIVLASDATKLLYSTYLGGRESGTHVDGGTCRFDKHGIVYHAVCAGCAATTSDGRPASDFPTTPHAWSRVNGSGNCNNAAFKFDLSSLTASIQISNVTPNQSGIIQVCTNDTIVFQNKSVGGEHYEWKLGDGQNLTRKDTVDIAHRYKTPGTYLVKLFAVDLGTCAKIDTATLVINAVDPKAVIGSDQTVCSNVATNLEASGGISYQWVSSDGKFTSAIGNPSIKPQITTSYYITVTDDQGCVVKDTVNVKVIPSIDIKMKLETTFDCETRPVLIATNLSDSRENLFFDFGDGTTSDEQRVVHEYQEDSTYVVKLIGQSNGCVFEQTQSVPIYKLTVPNVFTPDQSEGFNDSFKIKFSEHKPIPGVEPPIQMSLRVYNRWGKQVFTDDNYKNDWTAKEVDAGVYFYQLNVRDGTTCKGWVQVVK